MGSRGSRLSRSIQWFRESDVDEMRVAFALVKEIVEERLRASKSELARKKTLAPLRTRKAEASQDTVKVVEPPAQATVVGAS